MTNNYLPSTSRFVLLSFFIVFLTRAAMAQDAAANISDDVDKNVAKMNLTSLIFRNFSFQYERLIAPKITVGAGFRFMPKGGLPLLNSFESTIDDEETFEQLKNIKISHTSIAPEVRFYFGKKEGPRGFYLAPFVRYANYNLDFPEFKYEVEYEDGNDYYYRDETIALSGSINSFTGGLLIGSQWKLGKWVYLDWWILGVSYGTANGKLTGAANLPPEAQDALRDELDDLELDPIKVTSTVDANGARANLKGPWGGLRAGLSLGVKF